ncbi:MAG TPA: ThuA domain-containing protein [Armatimonadota bacterium]|nr:ThuA domain-containing protein [Armatimonadota bacterium]
MKKALLMLGGGFHNFEACGKILVDFLRSSGACEPIATEDRNQFLDLGGFDLVIDYTQGGSLTPEQESGLCAFVRNGGGFIGIHCASDSWVNNAQYMEMVGSHFIGHGPVTEFSVTITDPDHDVTRRIQSFRITDEFYILEKKTEEFHVLATGSWRGQTHPMAYVRDYGRGKVFYTANGHDERAFSNTGFQRLVNRAVRYVTGQVETGTIRAAVIGYGGSFNMGKHHAESINTVPGLKIVAVCDLDPKRAAQAKDDFPSIRTFSSVDALAADDGVDMVTVVTPHNDHYPTAMKLLNAGKHVVVEKPFCLNIQEATDMIEAARARQLMLSTFHNRRWDDDFLTIRQILREGAIGDPFHIEAYFGGYGHPGYWWRSHKPISGGAFYDWGAHFTDWTLNLMPYKMETFYGIFHKRVWHDVTNEDHCQALIRFEGGRTADLQQSSIAAVGKAKWRILGTKGGILQDSGDQIKVTSYRTGHREEIAVPLIRGGSWHSYYHNVADHLLAGEPLAVTPESARRVIAVLQLAEESARSGQPVPVPYED